MSHIRAKTELRYERPNLLQSVINSLESAIIFRLDVDEKANETNKMFSAFYRNLNN